MPQIPLQINYIYKDQDCPNQNSSIFATNLLFRNYRSGRIKE